MNDHIAGVMNAQKQKDEAHVHLVYADTATARSRSDCGCITGTHLTGADDEGGHDFILAAETGNIQSLARLIHELDKIDQKDEVLDTAFHASLSQGHRECVKKLVEFGVNVNARDGNGETALCSAAVQGHRMHVKTLLEAGATFDLEDTHDKTSLGLAASNGHLDCIIDLMYFSYRRTYRGSFLFSEIRNMYTRDLPFLGDRELREFKICLSLCMAAGLAQKDCLAALINTGLHVNLRLGVRTGSRPIYYAAAHGHLECMSLLINAGAEVNSGSEDELSPLHLALRGKHLKCVHALIQAGVDVNAIRRYLGHARPDFFGALDYDDTCTHYLNVMIEAGADVNLRNELGSTCLFLAASDAYLGCIEVLIRSGANVNAINKYGHTPICGVNMEDDDPVRLRCIETLIRAGANIYLRSKDYNFTTLYPSTMEKFSYLFDEVMINDVGTPAIVTAAWKGQSQQVARLVLESGVSVNAQGEDGTTALIAASWEGHRQCLDILLSVDDIDINAKDYCGRTALYAAACDGHIECMDKILVQEGGRFDLENALVAAVSKGQVKCLETLLGYLPETKKSHAEIDCLLERASENHCTAECMITLLRTGFFHWEWYEGDSTIFNKTWYRWLTRELVIHGYAPRVFDWNDGPCTPLMYAFRQGDCALVRYVLANLYLTPYDLSNLQNDTALHQYVYDKGSTEIQRLHHRLVCAPWRLDILSILRVFNMLRRYDCRQQEAVHRSGLANYLPNKFLETLSFCNPVRYLCVYEWNRIEGEFLNLKVPVWPGEDNMVENSRCLCVSHCKTIVDNEKKHQGSVHHSH